VSVVDHLAPPLNLTSSLTTTSQLRHKLIGAAAAAAAAELFGLMTNVRMLFIRSFCWDVARDRSLTDAWNTKAQDQKKTTTNHRHCPEDHETVYRSPVLRSRNGDLTICALLSFISSFSNSFSLASVNRHCRKFSTWHGFGPKMKRCYAYLLTINEGKKTPNFTKFGAYSQHIKRRRC